MNRATLLVLLSVFAGAFPYYVQKSAQDESNIDPYILEGVINSTIQELLATLPEPIEVEALDISLPDEEGALLTGDASISNLQISGINGLEVSYLNLAVIGMRLNFTFVLPSLNINTGYLLNLNVADLVPVYGDGSANVNIQGLEIQGTGQANLTNGIALTGLRLQIYIGSASFDIKGALNDEDFSNILSNILDDVAVPFIDDHQEFISDVISPIVESLLNSILAGGGETTVADDSTNAPA